MGRISSTVLYLLQFTFSGVVTKLYGLLLCTLSLMTGGLVYALSSPVLGSLPPQSSLSGAGTDI